LFYYSGTVPCPKQVSEQEKFLDELQVNQPPPTTLRTKLLTLTTMTPCPPCLHTLFENQVDKTPYLKCLIDSEYNSIQYEELNQKANQIAHMLLELQLPANSPIAVALERNIDFIAVVLGILKSGHAFLALDVHTLPKDRLRYMLQDCNAPILFTYHSLRSHFDDCTNFRIIILEWNRRFKHFPTSNLNLELNSIDTVAYIIYTSGSTGVPKGVLGTHAGMVNKCSWFWNSFPFTENEACALKTTLSFIDYVGEIFTPLLQGVPLYLISSEYIRDIDKLVLKLAEFKITRVMCVPSLVYAIVSIYGSLDSILPELKHWEVGGEPVTTDLAKLILTSGTNYRLVNVYGSSEVSGDAICNEITMNDVENETITIGNPISNMSCVLLDESCVVSDIGEICIAGIGVAKGYINNPSLTSEKFIVNTILPNGSSVLCKMGDLGKRLSDGRIVCMGRKDYQVKIRGIRVELLEIEKVIRQYKNVRKCAVRYWKESDTFSFLTAYIEKNNSDELLIEDLSQFLRMKLPDYMIPNNYVLLRELPLNTSGKIDRLALEKPAIDAFQQEHTYLNEMEQFICDTLATEIGRTVYPLSNVIDLGVSSLNIARLRYIVEKKYSVHIRTIDIINSESIRSYVETLEESTERCITPDDIQCIDIFSTISTTEDIIEQILNGNQFTDPVSGISLEIFSEKDLDEVSLFIGEIFHQEEPINHHLDITAEETAHFFRPVFTEASKNSLSVVAKLNDRVLGAAIAVEYHSISRSTIPEASEHWVERHRPIFELSRAIQQKYQSSVKQKKRTLFGAFTAVHPNSGLGTIVETISNALAIRAGYEVIVSELSSPLSLSLAREVGCEVELFIEYETFIDSRGNTPFKGLNGGIALATLNI
jgi:amino acid adenylation domain-containing protein